MKRVIIAFCIFSFLFLLIVFPSSSVQGAKSGLMLWFQIVLPTLLPFLIISNLIVELKLTNTISRFCYPILNRLLKTSKNGCYPIVIGLISGYPVGAKACGDMVKNGKIARQEGQFLLAFCNNASPMFIISFVAMEKLEIAGMGKYLIWVILVTSALFSSLFFQRLSHFIHHKKTKKHLVHTQDMEVKSPEPYSSTIFRLLDQTILNSFEIITKVGGYIILFSLLAQIIQDIPFLPLAPKLLVIGILEITTGVNTIVAAPLPIVKKIILCSSITAFGGLSAMAQTKSVIEGSGLSLSRYFLCKLLSGMITFLILFLLLQSPLINIF